MTVPTREARLAHAAKHCDLWNAGKKEEMLTSWRTIMKGSVRLFDPVGTKEKLGFDACFAETFDMFQPLLKMYMLTVHVNGDELAWVIENHFNMGGETHKTFSIETFAWDQSGDVLIKTYYDMPESVDADHDPYELLLAGEPAPSPDPSEMA
jgi:hypothetical protein